MATSVRGRFIAATKIKEVGQNGYKTRDFFVDLQGGSMYENYGKFKLGGDKIGIVDEIKKGQEIEVHFSIRGRKTKWADKVTGEEKESFFQDLEAWKVEVIERKAAGVVEAKPESFAVSGDEDDLPF